uniref:Uncharacterized protein n=3 Tax=Meloidogyne enterolobii TaxID=390850 RepID=A0A6V7VAI0_MELEN|nr:unnamed protein product [Meloidogyne enterolobii]
MKKQLQKQLPFELKNDIFRFLPIKKSILLITISSNIYLVNKKFIKKIWEKNRPLTTKEWTNLLTKMRKYCKEGKILKDVIKLIEINENMYGIRLFSEGKTLKIKIVGYRDHPINKEPRRIISYKLEPSTSRCLISYFEKIEGEN